MVVAFQHPPIPPKIDPSIYLSVYVIDIHIRAFKYVCTRVCRDPQSAVTVILYILFPLFFETRSLSCLELDR